MKESSEKYAGLKGYLPYLFTVLCMYILLFDEPCTDHGIALPALVLNIVPVIGAVALVYFAFRASDESRRRFLPYVIAGAVFLACGFIGYFMFRYQTFLITADGAYEHLRFFLSLYLFYKVAEYLPFRKYALRLFIHASFLSALLAALSYYDFFIPTWPRQIYYFGIGSIQLFFRHPSNFGAHCIFLLTLLTFLTPYLKEDASLRPAVRKGCLAAGTVLIILLLGSVIMTMRVRLIAFAAFYVLLYLYLIVWKRRLTFTAFCAGGAAALLIGWKRLYRYYFSEETLKMARGQLAYNAVRIANRYVPFGSGFGTFATRIAQIHYSPVYYKYGMIYTLGLSPEQSNYACDAYFPAIIAESGWLGTLAYACILLLLLRAVFRIQKNAADARHAAYMTFTALSLFVYELLEMTGTLAFAEPYSILIALVLGFSLSASRSS